MDYRKLKKFKEDHKVFYWVKNCNGGVFKVKEAYEIFIGGESEIILVDGDDIRLLGENEKNIVFSNYGEAVNKAKELRKRRLEVYDKAIELVSDVGFYDHPVMGSSDAYVKKYKDLLSGIERAYKRCVSDGLIKSDSEE